MTSPARPRWGVGVQRDEACKAVDYAVRRALPSMLSADHFADVSFMTTQPEIIGPQEATMAAKWIRSRDYLGHAMGTTAVRSLEHLAQGRYPDAVREADEVVRVAVMHVHDQVEMTVPDRPAGKLKALAAAAGTPQDQLNNAIRENERLSKDLTEQTDLKNALCNRVDAAESQVRKAQDRMRREAGRAITAEIDIKAAAAQFRAITSDFPGLTGPLVDLFKGVG